jgi:hypothetical protein
LCNLQGNEVDEVVELSHILQESTLTDPVIRSFCQDAMRTLSEFKIQASEASNNAFAVSGDKFDVHSTNSEFYSETLHKQQLLTVRDSLLKGLAGEHTEPESTNAVMISISNWLSGEAQLRMMADGAWEINMYRGLPTLLGEIVRHVNHVSMSTEFANSNKSPFGMTSRVPRPAPGSCLACRRLAKTRLGFLGFVPTSTRTGDAISCLYGSPTPIITRQVNIEDEHDLDKRIITQYREYVSRKYSESSFDTHFDGSIAASKVRHVVAVGLSLLDKRPQRSERGESFLEALAFSSRGVYDGNGRKDEKWTDLYAIH